MDTSTTRRTKRTDCHRPGAIEPRAYTHEVTYSCATTEGGEPVPAINVDEALHLMRLAVEDGRQVFGLVGSCGICGACFVYGELWAHEPTGDLLHVGNDCALKYALVAGRSDWDAKNEAVRRAVMAKAAHRRNIERARGALVELEAAHPGLTEALDVEHPIIADIAQRFGKYGSMSPKQVALVLKLADDVRNPKPAAPAEVLVPAPEGKQTFEGEIVSIKSSEGVYGVTLKMTVKVTTDAGVWLAWGTCPAGLCDALPRTVEGFLDRDASRGKRVKVTATLKPGRDAHFALTSRPKAALV